MNETEFHELRSAAVRRELSAAERARLETWLAGHPEWRAVWAEDRQLSRWLEQLPDVPVSSNFVTRVMGAAARAGRVRPARSWRPWRWVPLPGYAWRAAFVVLVLAGVWSVQHRQTRRQAELAESLGAIPVADLAVVDVWRDFDSVNALPLGPIPSLEELAQALE
jgi:anti-sigma factor RsiW